MTKTTVEVLRGMKPGFRLRGQVYVEIDLNGRYPGGGVVSLGQLGQDLVIQPLKILRALLSDHELLRAINSRAFEVLFEQNHRITELTYEDRPVLRRSERRDHLLQLATGARAYEGSKHTKARQRRPSYYDWTLPSDLSIAVPLSSGMVDVIEKSRRWTTIAPDIESFEKKLDDLADAVIGLRAALGELARVGQSGLQDVTMLTALSQYCELLLDQEGNPERDESPLAEFHGFLLDSAIPNFMRRIVCNPVDLAPDAAKRRDRYARKIMKILEDPEFLAGVELVVANVDIVPHELFDNLNYYLAASADLLSVTDLADEFADKHALPMMQGLTELPSKEHDRSIETIESPELRKVLLEGADPGVLPKGKSAFKTIGGLGSGLIGTVSNLEGPRSVFVAVLMQYHIHLFRRAAAKPWVGAFDNAVAKFLQEFVDDRTLHKNGPSYYLFRAELTRALGSGQKINFSTIAKECKVGVTRGPFRGRSARSAMLLISIAVAGLAYASSDGSSSSAFSVAAGVGTVGIATLDWPPIASAMERRWAGMAKVSGGLAGVVGAIGLAANACALRDAYVAGDDLGIVEGVLGTLGSAASVAGWLLCMKYGALAFAPSLLMTAGSILMVGGIALSIWRAFSPQEPVDIVNATLDSFQDPDSRAAIADLQPTVEALIALAREVDFRPLRPTYRDALTAMGFDGQTAAVLTGMA